MADDIDLLKRRLERERNARKQAEQIAEENTRALFIKGQKLEETLLKEQATRRELEILLTTLEAFTSRLDLTIIVRSLHQYLNHFIESQVTSLYQLHEDGVQIILLQVNRSGEAHKGLWESQTPFKTWQECPGFDKPSILSRRALGTLPQDMISLQAETACAMILPMTMNGQVVGFLVAENQNPGAFHEDQLRLSLALVHQASVALENARLFDKVEKLSRTDPLTGTRNRRGFEEEARRNLELALRYEQPLSVLMLDIDYFKKVNDTYGHPVGDIVLVRISETARKFIRGGDLLTRLGGEEFCLLLPQTSPENAFKFGERLREHIAGLEFEAADSTFGVTVSIGVTGLLHGGDTLEKMLERSDQALYKAKLTGRDRVVLWE